MKPTVFLAAGRITGALVAGLRLAQYKRPIVVHDLVRSMRELERRYDVIGEPELHRAVAPANMVVLAVRPGCGGGSIRPYRATTAGVDPRG